MAQPYVGEIRMFAGNFAPAGWMFCEGQLLPISEYETLFNLIGTTYGGDGQSTFALPDLRGRVPIHTGQGPGLSPYFQGQVGADHRDLHDVAENIEWKIILQQRRYNLPAEAPHQQRARKNHPRRQKVSRHRGHAELLHVHSAHGPEQQRR